MSLSYYLRQCSLFLSPLSSVGCLKIQLTYLQRKKHNAGFSAHSSPNILQPTENDITETAQSIAYEIDRTEYISSASFRK